MAGVGSSEFDCPVCFNFFTTPKILPCYHLVCQSCVLSWIERTGGRGQCPVCRAPILSEPRTGSQLQTEVNRLPTDFATQALAESHSILSGPHQCGMCTNNVAAQDFCLLCSLKLCSACTKYHHKLPATSHHTVQQLNTLTVNQLAARHQVKCKTHTHELALLYCTTHSKLVCFRCGATTHHTCLKLRDVQDAAKEERRKLQDRLERLEVKESNLAQQVDDIRDHLKAMRTTAQKTFGKKRRRDVLNLIQSEEDAMKASLEKMENARVSTALPIRNISNLVLESPDDGLLEISQNLLSRLDNLESQMDLAIRNLRSDLAQLGHTRQSQQQVVQPSAREATPTSAWSRFIGLFRPKPRGAELAGVLKVGDRVKLISRAPTWGGIQPGDKGTVTAIPSQILATPDWDPKGWVDVRWDNGHQHWHPMGWNNEYNLILS